MEQGEPEVEVNLKSILSIAFLAIAIPLVVTSIVVFGMPPAVVIAIFVSLSIEHPSVLASLLLPAGMAVWSVTDIGT